MWWASLASLLITLSLLFIITSFSGNRSVCSISISKSSINIIGCETLPDLSKLDFGFLQGIECDRL